MELAQFWYLKSLVDAGSPRIAARRCGVPQAMLMRALADLEDELHVELFRHTGSRSGLTPFGARIIGHVDAIINGVTEIHRMAGDCASYESPRF